MNMRWYFLLLGLVNFVALGVALILSLTVLGEYFSYFTVQSNILVTAVFLTIGLSNPKTVRKNKFLQWCYAPAVLYMCITGIVYWTILHGGRVLTTDVEWITLVLHGIMPIAAVVGWFLYAGKRYSWKNVFVWLVYPLVFVMYTLSRGQYVDWYPYPFLNPTLIGYTGVAAWTVGIITGAFLVGELLVFIGKKFNK